MEKYTPMIRQFLEIKEDYQDSLIFFRLGDFYELFFEDAEVAARELDLVLTARSGGKGIKVPMAGVPHHASDSYIQRLTNRGYKIAIVEQLEDPADTKGLVDRGVVKVVTPGTIMDELSDNSESIFLAAIHDYSYGYSVAICEMASGRITVSDVEYDHLVLAEKLLSENVKEVVIADNLSSAVVERLEQLPHVLVSTLSANDEVDTKAYDTSHLFKNVTKTYHHDVLDLLLQYLTKTQMKILKHLRPAEIEKEQDYLKMDYASISNLELVESLKQSGTKISLWQFINHTKTALGSRLLKEWVAKPLVNVEEIHDRQNRITIIKEDFLLRDSLEKHLKEIYDLERLIAKFAYGNANPTDGVRLRQSLAVMPNIFNDLYQHEEFQDMLEIDDGHELYLLLDAALIEEPPVSIREGKIFKDGYNQELDELRETQRNGQQWILDLEAKEREKTGINNLKVGYNRVFGYYYEVTKANFGKIKEEDGYVRKQTLTNSERFITEELKEHEDLILNADEKVHELEYRLYLQLVASVVSFMPQVLALANFVAELDALYALAVVANKSGYVEVDFDQSQFIIEEGRHPILEEIMQDQQYVSNSLKMTDDDLWLITGPNMGGKSTFMRQCALIVILAQIGSHVPATRCVIPIFDQIFTRIGASDDILSGQSTFMVEMHEANNALQKATENSLIIFDEIGRGTSTYDGLSLAQAMIEYIASNIKAKTLFSTHYHELTGLSDSFDNIHNYHVEVHEEDDEVTFLYRMLPGCADRSYGINVARLAELPEAVINRAHTILLDLEADKKVMGQGYKVKEVEVIPKEVVEILTVLEESDVNQMTPLDAMQLLADLQEKTK